MFARPLNSLTIASTKITFARGSLARFSRANDPLTLRPSFLNPQPANNIHTRFRFGAEGTRSRVGQRELLLQPRSSSLPQKTPSYSVMSESLNVKTLRETLANLGLDSRGHKKDLKKRLKKVKREDGADTLKQVVKEAKEKENGGKVNETIEGKETVEGKEVGKAKEAAEGKEAAEAAEGKKEAGEAVESKAAVKKKEIKRQPFDYYLCFDVEATCDRGTNFNYPNEIIEFPIVLLDGRTFEIVDEFRSYVKPSVTLSEFCVELTGIQQSTVDVSPSFIEVLNLFQTFLAKYSLFQDHTAAFITDGPWDIRDFITKQCTHSGIPRPAYFSVPWVDVRSLFHEYRNEIAMRNIESMLKGLGLKFEGRQHSGLDDARNVARIVRWLAEDGAIIKTNRKWEGDGVEKSRRIKKGKEPWWAKLKK